MDKKLSLKDLLALRNQYEKEIENLKLNLSAVNYIYGLVCADIAAQFPEGADTTPIVED